MTEAVDTSTQPTAQPAAQQAAEGGAVAQQAPAQQQPVQQQPVQQPVQQPAPTAQEGEDLEATLLGGSGEDDTETDMFEGLFEPELLEDRAANLAASYLRAALPADIDLGRALGAAIQSGDLDDVDTNYLHEVLGGDTEGVFLAIEQLFASAESINEAFQEEIYASIPGGREGLEQAVEVFRTNASEEQQAAMRYLMNSKDVGLTKFAAQYVYETVRANGGVVDTGTQSFGQPGGLQGLTRAEYVQAIQKPNLTDTEYQQLRQQRAIGMKQGI